MRWECHVDDSAEGRYRMILGQDLLTDLELDLNISKQVILVGDETYKWCTDPMVDMSDYDYKYLNLKDNVKQEESFMDACVEEVFEYENISSSTKR